MVNENCISLLDEWWLNKPSSNRDEGLALKRIWMLLLVSLVYRLTSRTTLIIQICIFKNHYQLSKGLIMTVVSIHQYLMRQEINKMLTYLHWNTSFKISQHSRYLSCPVVVCFETHHMEGTLQLANVYQCKKLMNQL